MLKKKQRNHCQSKNEKRLQRERQKELLTHPKQMSLYKVNIIRLLDNFTEDEIAKGLHLAATSIDKNFSSLSYFIPYIKKANNTALSSKS